MPTPSRKPNQRSAMALIAVIALMAAASLLFATWTRSTVTRLRVERRAHDRVQAVWIAEAGLRRAAARLVVDPEYGGETWAVEGDELLRPTGAEVVIAVEPLADQPGARRVTATADLPPGSSRRVRFAKTLTFPIATPVPPDAGRPDTGQPSEADPS